MLYAPATGVGPGGHTAGLQAPTPSTACLAQLSRGGGKPPSGGSPEVRKAPCSSERREQGSHTLPGLGGSQQGREGTHHLPHTDTGRLHHGPISDGAGRLLLDVRVSGEQLLHHLPAGQRRGTVGRGAGAPGALAGRGAYFTFRYSSRVMRPSLSESYMWNRTGGAGEGELIQGRWRGAGSPWLPKPSRLLNLLQRPQ